MLFIFVILFCSRISDASRIFHLGKQWSKNNVQQSHLESLPEAEWFVQPLDHFNLAIKAFWKQRFFRNDTFYKEGGPVFLMVGGEGEARPIWMQNGAWIDFAQQYGALCFMLEHRYYGESRPVPDLKVKKLAFLNSQQALSDLAAFIESMNEKLPPETRWILFGGSYPGSLVAWARLKYPHLVHAAVSTSGPLLAIADFKDYMHVVIDALNTTSPKCVDAFAAAQSQLESMLSHRVGQQTASKMFRLCSPIDPTSSIDRESLFEALSSNVAGVVQYNKDNRKFSGAKGANITLDTVCGIMTNTTADVAVRRLAALSNMILDTYGEKCLDYTYESTVNALRNDSWDSTTAEGGRQWMYQCCMEFGFFQTSSVDETIRLFGEFSLELFQQQCTDVFGNRFNAELLNRGINNTNTDYGSLNYITDRVVFVHGSIDPWHALGITKDVSPQSPAIFIEGTAHCANMYPAAPDDPPQLVAARKRISEIIGDWLKK